VADVAAVPLHQPRVFPPPQRGADSRSHGYCLHRHQVSEQAGDGARGMPTASNSRIGKPIKRRRAGQALSNGAGGHAPEPTLMAEEWGPGAGEKTLADFPL